MEQISIETLRGGALMEAANHALAQVLLNISDPNTPAKAKRSVVIKIEFKPNEDRDLADIAATVEPKLAAPKAIETGMSIGTDRDLNPVATEWSTSLDPKQHVMPGVDPKTGNAAANNVTPLRAASGS